MILENKICPKNLPLFVGFTTKSLFKAKGMLNGLFVSWTMAAKTVNAK
jgi:hypothetical protein